MKNTDKKSNISKNCNTETTKNVLQSKKRLTQREMYMGGYKIIYVVAFYGLVCIGIGASVVAGELEAFIYISIFMYALFWLSYYLYRYKVLQNEL